MDIIITFNEPYFKVLEEVLEHNTDTSAQPLSNKGEDIVRPILNNEGIELEDKEPLG